MTPADDDAAAILASCTEPQAFTVVFDRHFDPVNWFLRRRVAATVADELTAETFARAFEARFRYRLDRPDARPWLFGIAVNLLGHHYRSEERQLRAYARAGVDPLAGEADDPEARVDAELAGPSLAAALAELSPEERDVLLLFAWADLGYNEIAEALGIAVGTVRAAQSRSRARASRPRRDDPLYIGAVRWMTCSWSRRFERTSRRPPPRSAKEHAPPSSPVLGPVAAPVCVSRDAGGRCSWRLPS